MRWFSKALDSELSKSLSFVQIGQVLIDFWGSKYSHLRYQNHICYLNG
jgi:hypothetical protein